MFTRQFTNGELAQLHLLLYQDLTSSRIELHQPAHQPYWEYLKRRMAQEMALLKKIEHALPMLRTGGEDRWATGMFFMYSIPMAQLAPGSADTEMQ